MGDAFQGKENVGAGGRPTGPSCQQLQQQHDSEPCSLAGGAQPSARLRLAPVDVRLTDTPPVALSSALPVSCPSRLQHSSPARSGSFDPFAAPDEPPGCTPLCGPAHPAAPPVVRKGSAGGSGEGSPAAAPRPALFADRVQSCPPERVGRRGARPLVRLRVKRSLNGAVAAAGPPAVRRSLDALPGPQLAGCSRKRFEEADLVSPPMPRKSSRTLLDDEAAADMMARLQLAASSSGAFRSGAQAGSAALPGQGQGCPAAALAMVWAPAAAAAAEATAPRSVAVPPAGLAGPFS